MKSDPPRVRALRRQLTATFYRKNKATFFVTAGAMLLLGGALLAVAWILQQIIDIASGDSVAPLVRMCWLCLGVLVSVTTIYVVQCYTYPAFLRRAMKQYKEIRLHGADEEKHQHVLGREYEPLYLRPDE